MTNLQHPAVQAALQAEKGATADAKLAEAARHVCLHTITWENCFRDLCAAVKPTLDHLLQHETMAPDCVMAEKLLPDYATLVHGALKQEKPDVLAALLKAAARSSLLTRALPHMVDACVARACASMVRPLRREQDALHLLLDFAACRPEIARRIGDKNLQTAWLLGRRNSVTRGHLMATVDTIRGNLASGRWPVPALGK